MRSDGAVQEAVNDSEDFVFTDLNRGIEGLAKAEDALRESEERFRALVDNVPGVVYRCAAQPPWPAEYVSAGCSDLTGRPAADFVTGAADWFGLAAPDDAPAVRAALRRAVAKCESFAIEFRFERADGAPRWAASKGRCVCDANGNPRHLDGVTTDITDHKLVEESMRLAAVGQLAAGVAHEFNNLLCSMMIRAGLVQSEPNASNSQMLADIVDRNARRGALICQRLTHFSRPQKSQRARFDIEEPIAEALALVAPQLAGQRIEVLREGQDEVARIVGDPDQLQEVFLNLFINSGHAMPNGGQLTIGTRRVPNEEGEEEIVVEVTDTGTGIASDHLSRVFLPFFTTKGTLAEGAVRGIGLGLSVSHGIVTAHQGTISVRSALGVGTTLELRFPACPRRGPAAAAAQAVPQSPQQGLNDLRVLLAEDDQQVREAIATLLEMHGCYVTAAADATEAIARLWTAPFDLVIVDLLMPGGGAPAVIERGAARLGAEVPVVVITGQLQPDIEELRASLGVAAVLRKPMTPQQMLAVIAEVSPGTPRLVAADASVLARTGS
jgi:PAS domain S-box-containing protein